MKRSSPGSWKGLKASGSFGRTPQTYCLLIEKTTSGAIAIGRLGKFQFPGGYYVYTGSGRRGLEARINRHISKEKRLRWHIDYLLAEARVKAVYLFDEGECEVNRRVFSLPGSSLLVKKFGSSDCSCASHLAYFKEGRAPPLELLSDNVIKKLFK